MLYLVYRATSPIEDIDEGGVSIVLLVDLEAQVNVENIVEVQHLISIYWQASNSHVVQCGAYHAE